MATPRSKKTAKKAKPKSKAKHVKAELVGPIIDKETGRVEDLPALKKRMMAMYHCNNEELQQIKDDPDTPMHDLIILRQLKNMRDHADVPTMLFFFDIIFSQHKLMMPALGHGDGDQVTVYQIPANGSETLDDGE